MCGQRSRIFRSSSVLNARVNGDPDVGIGTAIRRYLQICGGLSADRESCRLGLHDCRPGLLLFFCCICVGLLWDDQLLYSVSQKNPPWRLVAIFPKRLGIFQPNFTCLLRVPIYARLRIFIQLSATLTKLCHINCDSPACVSVDGGHFEQIMVVALIIA